MKRMTTLFLFMVIFFVSGCQAIDDLNQTTDPSIEKLKPEFIEGEDYDEYGGADAYDFSGDNASSRYYVNPDFYRLASDNELTIIESFQTMQQTTEWSCGPAAALMTLWHFGKTDLTEMDIAKVMTSSVDENVDGAEPGSADNFYEYGTNVGEMVKFFEALDGFKVVETSYIENYSDTDLVKETDGLTPADVDNLYPTFSSSSLYASENSDETENWVEDAKDSYFVNWLTTHLKAGRPIMVEWGDWDGHWVTIIGYDNNGTPSIGDDILIFADSYDTSDHWQDGYSIASLERFFYMWKDRNVAPKPYQLQPYLVIDIEQ
ncbi:MAG TPA: hypothetical protein DCY20_01860 [Firmicutes bacterium]|nr:hypothetical protein [Bacillota bacterium]